MSAPFRGWRLVFLTSALALVGVGRSLADDAKTATDAKPADAKTTDAKPADPKAADAAKAILAGHSLHGEAFNAGPRQRAYLMGGTGHTFLKTTTAKPEAQQFFDQGVGQLHGFWYYESERSFRQAAVIDPDCAMNYWGMAMSNVNNEKRTRGFIAKAVERRDKASRREQMWIDAYAKFFDDKAKRDDRRRREQLVLDLEGIIQEFPGEIEAKAFLAGQLWVNSTSGVPLGSRQAVDSLIKEVLSVEPMHPVHHYRIHMWDDAKPAQALAAAASCGQSAPSIAHMWHMPGHIYTRLRRYDDAAWQQEASARVDHAHMIRDRVMPYQIHNYAHNNQWCSENLAFIGRVNDAVSLAKNLLELPRHPSMNNYGTGGAADNGRQRLFEYLNRFELWDETLALENTTYLEATDKEEEQLRRLRLIGAAHFGKSQFEAGQVMIEDLKARLAANTQAAEKAEKEAEEKAKTEKKPDDQIVKAKAGARKPMDDNRGRIEQSLAELRGQHTFARGQFKEALDQFAKAGGRISQEMMSQTQLRAGDNAKALATAKGVFDGSPSQVLPLANYTEVLYRAGKTAEASEKFTALRTLAGHADLSMPALARLADVARELKLPEDWRTPAPAASDVGVRPPLDSLGPFRWTPYVADDWALTNGQGKPISLAQYRGKPVIVIFYLGYGCLHCVEQLNNFAPKTQEFADAGISLVAVSTDAMPDLQKSLEKCSIPGGFPFPLASDADLGVFKQYRAFDDFENAPMHGTFLIDGKGLVRWQDVGPDPFNDPAFLLKEAKRLLSQSSGS